MEEPDPNVFINGTKIRARTCEIEPYMHPAEPTEIPPERDIKIINIQHKINRPVDIMQITLIILISGLTFIVFIVVFIILKIFYKRKKSYKTYEEREILAHEVNLRKSYDSLFQVFN